MNGYIGETAVAGLVLLGLAPWFLIARGKLHTTPPQPPAVTGFATEPRYADPEGPATLVRQLRAPGGQFTEAVPGAKRIHRKRTEATP